MSLRDQLLKAGLVSSEKVRQAEREARQQSHQTKKSKTAAAAEAARKAEQRRQRDEQARRERERDRELNRQRDSEKRRRAVLAQVRQLLDSQRQNDANAELLYNLQVGKKIRRLRVTDKQRKLLAMGRLGVARNPHDPFDLPIVSRSTALKLQSLGDEFIALLHPESSRLDDDDWPDDS